jgi:hypothetical protein
VIARAIVAFLALASAACTRAMVSSPLESGPWRVYRGASDASAAVFLDGERIVVADDEDNVLRIYSAERAGAPLSAVDVSSFLRVDPRKPEADIEAAARVGDRIYWITSHGRSRKGKVRESRGRFFATDVVSSPDGSTVRPAGEPSSSLGPAILAALERGGLGSGEGASKALNVEGLAAAPDGTLYIGLRAPTVDRDGRELSIVLPLRNAKRVVEEAAEPEIGEPLLWDLDGRAIRSMEREAVSGAFLVAVAGKGGASLYRWSGRTEDAPARLTDLLPKELDGPPEALAARPGTGPVLVVVDDGAARVPVEAAGACKGDGVGADGTCRNKDLRDSSRKVFRGVEIAP